MIRPSNWPFNDLALLFLIDRLFETVLGHLSLRLRRARPFSRSLLPLILPELLPCLEFLKLAPLGVVHRLIVTSAEV